MYQSLDNDSLVKWLKLTQVKNGLGPARLKKLLEFYGGLNKVFSVADTELENNYLITPKIFSNLKKLINASNEEFYKLIEECKRNSIFIIPLIDKRYPNSLRFIPSPPLTLFAKGNLELLNNKRKKIAIVGARNASSKALDISYDMSFKLSNENIIIISGGAEGVDTKAHQAALDSKNSATISVLGSGFFHPFPIKNKPLFDKIIDSGNLLVTENSPNFKGSRISYLQRNRIISGLSDAIFVVAAEEVGGGIVQVRIAKSQKKPIFCPKLESNIMPQAGIIQAIEKYEAIQIDKPDQLINLVREPLQSYNVT